MSVGRLTAIMRGLERGAAGLGLVTLVSACTGVEGRVAIHAVTEDGHPVAGLEVTALPFDPDHLRDSLARAAEIPRPSFPELEAELRTYERPEDTTLVEISAAWRATWDSVRHLADSLTGVRPSASGYAVAYTRLREQYRRLAERAVERDRAFQQQVGDHRELATRAAMAADSLRAWEDVALRAFGELADSALARSGDTVHSVTTDVSGGVEVHLPPGAWWLIARRPDPDNPFVEHYWNIPLVVAIMGPLRVPLDERTGTARWRR